MCNLVKERGFEQKRPRTVWENSMACIYMPKTSVMLHKAKNLNLDPKVYHLQEKCKKGVQGEQAAASLTNATPLHAFTSHCNVMLGHMGGGCR